MIVLGVVAALLATVTIIMVSVSEWRKPLKQARPTF
jgi:hypothetical protein